MEILYIVVSKSVRYSKVRPVVFLKANVWFLLKNSNGADSPFIKFFESFLTIVV
jgi:hypothetical protein